MHEHNNVNGLVCHVKLEYWPKSIYLELSTLPVSCMCNQIPLCSCYSVVIIVHHMVYTKKRTLMQCVMTSVYLPLKLVVVILNL